MPYIYFMDPVAIRLRWGNSYIGYMVFIVYVYVHFNFWITVDERNAEM